MYLQVYWLLLADWKYFLPFNHAPGMSLLFDLMEDRKNIEEEYKLYVLPFLIQNKNLSRRYVEILSVATSKIHLIPPFFIQRIQRDKHFQNLNKLNNLIKLNNFFFISKRHSYKILG